MIMCLAYLRSVDRWCRARRHGPVATQRRSTSTEQLFCANGVASTSKRRERSPLAPRASPPPTTDATLQGTLTRITPLLAHTPPRPYSSHRPASTASTLSHFLSLSPTRCYAPRGSHPRGTCARILPPVRRNSSRGAVGIGKNGAREKEEDTKRGWLERVKIWGAAFSEKKGKKEKRMPSFFLSASSAPSSSSPLLLFSSSVYFLHSFRACFFFPNSFFPNSSYHKSCLFFSLLSRSCLSTSLKNAWLNYPFSPPQV